VTHFYACHACHVTGEQRDRKVGHMALAASEQRQVSPNELSLL